MFSIRNHKTIVKAILFRKVIRPLIILLVIVWLLYFWMNFGNDKSFSFKVVNIFKGAKSLLFLILFLLIYTVNKQPILKIPIKEDTRVGVLILHSFLDMELQSTISFYNNQQYSGVAEYTPFLLDRTLPHNSKIKASQHFLEDLESEIWQYARTILVNNNSNPSDTRFGTSNSIIVSCSDENWKNVVSVIMQKAKVIFLSPSNSKGVLEEFQLINKYELYFKTIIYMPPSDEDNNYRNKWNSIRENLIIKGLELPIYSEEGMFYIPNEDFNIKKKFTRTYSLWKLSSHIIKNEVNSEKHLLKDILLNISAVEGYNRIK